MAAISFSFIACSDDDDDTPTATGEHQLPSTTIRKYTPDGNENNINTETEQYTYDSNNRITEIISTFLSSTDKQKNAMKKITISYLSDGKVEKMTYTPLTGEGDKAPITSLYSYNGNEIEVKTTAGVVVETIWIDDNGRITKSETASDAANSARSVTPTTTVISYQYDANGNITSQTYDNTGYIYKCTYDTSKKGMFAAVKSPQWLLVSLTSRISDYKNSPTQISDGTADNITVSGNYTYICNSDNYPIEQTFTPTDSDNKYKGTTTIQYINAK
jgi:LVIVD repeat.